MYSLKDLSKSWVVASLSFSAALPITRQLADRADCLLIAGIFPSVDNAIR